MLVFIIYSGMDDSKQGAQDRFGAFAFIVMNAAFTSMQAGNTVFPMERPVFLREVNNGMYRVSTYFASKVVADAPLLVAQIGLQSALVYFLIGLNTHSAEKPATFFAAMLLVAYAFTGLGYIVGALARSMEVVSAATPLLVVPQMLFAGFFVNQENVPSFLWPLHHLSAFKYAYQVLVLNEFSDSEMACMKTTDPTEFCDPLGDYNSPQTIASSFLVLGILTAVFFLMALLIMKSLSRSYD